MHCCCIRLDGYVMYSHWLVSQYSRDLSALSQLLVYLKYGIPAFFTVDRCVPTAGYRICLSIGKALGI